MTRKLLLVVLLMAVAVLPAFSLFGFFESMQTQIENSKSYDEKCKRIRDLIAERTKEKIWGGTEEGKLRTELNTKDKDGLYPIFVAVYNNDVELTKTILRYMDNIELYDPNDFSLLQIVAWDAGDRTAILQLLLDRNLSKSYLDYSCNNNGWTALNIAIDCGNKKIAELLLDRNADPNITEKENNETPLIKAIKSDAYKNLDERIALVKLLVEKGANINYSSKTSGSELGVTPLFLAVVFDYRGIVKFLLEKGADVNAVNSYANEGIVYTETVLDFMCDVNNRDMIEILLGQEGIKLDTELKIRQGNTIVCQETPLFNAVRNSSEETIRRLLEKGADVNKANNIYLYDAEKNLHLFDASALNLACFQGMESIADILMENGADVNLPLRYEDTDYDGSINTYERSLLHWAYYKGYKDLLVSLLNHGADVNKQNNAGETVLHWAAGAGDYKTYSLLKEYGGDITIKDNAGEAPWKKFEQYDKTAADRIRRYYEMRDQDASASADLENFISTILPEYINHKTSDDSAMTVLQIALANKDEAGARELIEKGADYTLADKDGDNALDYAIKKDLSRLVEYLADKPKAISRKSVFNALDKMNQEAAILLLKNGADYTLLNGKGSNVLDCAIDLGLKDVVDYLADKKDAMSKTVLFRALEKEDQRSALLLLEKGADYKVSKGEDKAFDYAMAHNMQDVVDYLADQDGALSSQSLFNAIDKDLKDNTSFVPQVLDAKDKPVLSKYDSRLSSTVNPVLYTSLSYPEEGTYPFERKKAIIDALKDKGYNLDEKVSSGTQSGKTALFYAVEHDDYDFVKFLLESGADPTISQKGDYAGRTPLCYALERKNEAIISLLLEKLGENIADIKLSNQNDHNTTLLMLFARYGSSDNMKYALPKMIAKSSQCLDAKDNDGRTAFMYAAQYNENHRVMAILRMYGCDIFAKDKNGHTALDIATAANSPNVERLKSYGL